LTFAFTTVAGNIFISQGDPKLAADQFRRIYLKKYSKKI
jgi:hypothetical protein